MKSGNSPGSHVPPTGTTTPRGRFRNASSPRSAVNENGTVAAGSSPLKGRTALSSSSQHRSSAHDDSGVDAEVAAHLARRAEAMANRSDYDLDGDDDDDDEDAAQNESLRRSYALAAGSVPQPQQSHLHPSSSHGSTFGGGGSKLMPAPLDFDAQKQGADRQSGDDGHGDSALSNGNGGGGHGASSSIQSTADFLARRRQRQQQAAAQGVSVDHNGDGEGSRGNTPFNDRAEGFSVADNDNENGVGYNNGGGGENHNDDDDDNDDDNASGCDNDRAYGSGVRYEDDEFAYLAKENLVNPQPVSAGNKEGSRRASASKPAPANPYGSSANPRGGARGGKKKLTAKAPGAVKFPALPKGRLSR